MLVGEVTMIAPIATLIFATAMALSLSIEAESFFHTPPKASAAAEAAAEASAAGADATEDASADSTVVP
jgi:hypothetical protein